MKPVLPIYATREGRTRRIAEHLGKFMGEHKHLFALVDAGHLPHRLELDQYSTAIVGASLHIGKYEPEMTRRQRKRSAKNPSAMSGARWKRFSRKRAGRPLERCRLRAR
jgi:menaquinone-dependent protoporphyrinogen IX oxidase